MEKDRETMAKELALAHGYEWDTTEKAVRSAWLKRADELIREEETRDTAVCPKCGGWGFTEREHGLFRTFCDCKRGQKLRAEVTGETPDVLTVDVIDETPGAHPEMVENIVHVEDSNDSNIGTEQPVSKPIKPKKRKRKTKIT